MGKNYINCSSLSMPVETGQVVVAQALYNPGDLTCSVTFEYDMPSEQVFAGEASGGWGSDCSLAPALPACLPA